MPKFWCVKRLRPFNYTHTYTYTQSVNLSLKIFYLAADRWQNFTLEIKFFLKLFSSIIAHVCVYCDVFACTYIKFTEKIYDSFRRQPFFRYFCGVVIQFLMNQINTQIICTNSHKQFYVNMYQCSYYYFFFLQNDHHSSVAVMPYDDGPQALIFSEI